MAGSWLPRTEGAFVIWFINWNTKIQSTYGALFGLTVPEMAAVAADLAALQFMVNASETIKTRTQDVNDYKRQLIHGPGPIGAFPTAPTFGLPPTAVLADMIARIDVLAARFKIHSSYTTMIGEDLGIESPAPGPDPTAIEIEAKALPGSQVEVSFKKAGSDGAWIEGSVDDGPWVALGSDRFSPYVDTRPPAVAGKAEVRKYRARPLSGDTPTGDWSNIAQASTIP